MGPNIDSTRDFNTPFSSRNLLAAPLPGGAKSILMMGHRVAQGANPARAVRIRETTTRSRQRASSPPTDRPTPRREPPHDDGDQSGCGVARALQFARSPRRLLEPELRAPSLDPGQAQRRPGKWDGRLPLVLLRPPLQAPRRGLWRRLWRLSGRSVLPATR